MNLSANEKMALRTAYQDILLTVQGESSNAWILTCWGNIVNSLIRKGLAVHGGKLGRADADMLTLKGEEARRRELGLS